MQFWSHFVDQPKYFDGAPEPLECGAVQIISNWVKAHRVTVLYPFSGSPYPPVYTWAPRDGSCHCFAAGMLVHDQADLLGALIGALTVSEQHEQPTSSYCQICCLRFVGHAAMWSRFVASIPSLNVTPVMTLAR